MKKPDFAKIMNGMDRIHEGLAEAGAIHTAAADFVTLAKKNHKIENIPALGMQGMLITGECLTAFQNLMSLTHPR